MTATRRALSSPSFRRWSWLVIVALVVVSLVRNAVDEGPPRTEQDRVAAISETLACPTCDGQSVADSDSAAARAIRAEIAERVALGQPADQIRTEIDASYSENLQLTPSGSGFEGLVWFLPVLALVLALGALTATFTRWRRAPLTKATDADRQLVEQALRHR